MNIDQSKYSGTTSYALKESLKALSREDKQIRIEKLWNILIHLHSHGEWNYGISAIGKKLEEHGVQKAQSYRNAQGKDYRDIVDAFALDWGVKTSHLHQNSTTPLEDAISSLTDRDAQARIRITIAEAARLKIQNEQLRQQLSKMIVASPAPKPYSETSSKDIKIIEQFVPVTARPNMQSIERFLEDDWLEGHGLAVGKNGAISYSGHAITLPKFHEQLTAMLNYVKK